MASNTTVTPDTLITIKTLFESENRRFKIPLRELGANTLPSKVSHRSSDLIDLVGFGTLLT